MIAPTELDKILTKARDRRLNGDLILDQIKDQLDLNLSKKEKLSNSGDHLQLDLLNPEKLYHISDIKHLCINYRLRFLDTRYFKSNMPIEAHKQIAKLESQHGIKLDGLKIMAPSKMFALENADDPLLFAPVFGGYYYLVHKWGNDLHPLRKMLVWPFKCFENLVFTVFLLSILVTWLLPMELFSKTQSSVSESFMLFLFTFKAVGAIVLYYGFAKGKNFNTAIWNSKYYNA